jgi:ankyrin repeat protein
MQHSGDILDAANRGDLKLLRECIVCGQNVNMRWFGDWTPLMYAALDGNLTIVHALIVAGADVNARDIYGTTALNVASIYNNREIVAVLFNHMFAEALAKVIDRDLLMVICEFV